jgi:hypothetical protein
MRSSKLLLIYAIPTLILLGTLWALAIWAPGDRAAFFGALALYLAPISSLAGELFDRWEHEANLDGLSSQEREERFKEAMTNDILPRARLRIDGFLFRSTVAAGLWIGVWAYRPLLMAICAFIAMLALGRSFNSPPELCYFAIIRNVGTLSAAVALGMAFRALLN